MILPSSIRSALERLADGEARTALAGRSRALTATYQARQNSAQTVLTRQDALAYALARMPATYAAAQSAMHHLALALPTFEPASMIDVGCGPGSASFAALEVFPDLARIALLDRNGPLLDLAATLLAAIDTPCRMEIARHDVQAKAAAALPETDLIVASYVLAELDSSTRQVLVAHLWSATGTILLLVEPGTPDGFQRLKEARNALIQAGGHVAAPCTHDAICPMQGAEWCRFMVRVQRSRDHKLLKSASRPFEDEPFAYLAVSREKTSHRKTHRLITRPRQSKAALTIDICGEEGRETHIIPSRDKRRFKHFKGLEWGDAVEILIQESLAEDEVTAR